MSNSQNSVLVLGAGGNAGRNVIKCLRRSPLRPHIIGLDLNAHYLRACDADDKYITPPTEDAKLELVQKLRPDLVIAQPEPEVDFIARQQAQLGGRIVGLNHKLLRFSRDKLCCQALWGCRVFNFEDASLYRFNELAAAAGKVWIRARQGAGSRAALPVQKFSEAQAWVEFWVNNRGMKPDDFMLAPYLPGPEYAVQLLWWKGELVHCQARERVVHFFAAQSPSGQSSTPAIARTIRDPRVTTVAVVAARQLADRVNAPLHGIFGVDLRCDATGKPTPTECNYGRFFTTVDFFAALGLNTPDALLHLHLGLQPPPPPVELPDDRYWVRGLDQAPVLV